MQLLDILSGTADSVAATVTFANVSCYVGEIDGLVIVLNVHRYIYLSFISIRERRGPGSSVGIATDYGLDGPGSNPGGDEIFRPSRPALGSTQPPVHWVPGLPQG